jgi:hypothetical protein
VSLPQSSKKKRFHHFDGFESRIHDFSWVLDWKALGKPYCHLYVIGPKDGRPVKVGVSVDCHSRLAGIQTGNWNDLYVLKTVWTDSVKSARTLERETHRALQRHHLSGEWFDVEADEALESVKWVADFFGIKITSGVPDELVDAVFESIRARMQDEYTSGSTAHQKIRVAKLADYGISKSTIDAVRGKEMEFDQDWADQYEAKRQTARR